MRSNQRAFRKTWARMGLPIVRFGRRVLVERTVLEAQLRRDNVPATGNGAAREGA